MKPGELFKRKRVEKGLSVAQAAKELYIQEKYILALEDDNYDIIPGETYQRAYFKKYANYLGLGDVFDRAAREDDLDSGADESDYDGILGGTWNTDRILRVAARFAILIIIVVAITAGINKMKNPSEPVVDEPERVSGTIEVVPADPSSSSWQIPDSFEPGAVDPLEGISDENSLEVTLNASGQCWVDVETRDGILFSNTMNRGDTLTWNDYYGFFIHAGAPQNLEVLFNGEPVTFEHGSMDLYLPPTFILDPGPEPDMNPEDNPNGE